MAKESFEPKIMQIIEKRVRDAKGISRDMLEVEFLVGERGPFHITLSPEAASEEEIITKVKERIHTMKAIYELTS